MVLRAILLIVSLTALLGLHAASVSPEHDWYNTFWWLDIVMHFAGGLWVAFFFLTIMPLGRSFFLVVFAACVGVVWEALEYFLNVPFFGVGEARFADSLWILDTLSDLFFDILAASIAAIVKYRYTKVNV